VYSFASSYSSLLTVPTVLIVEAPMGGILGSGPVHEVGRVRMVEVADSEHP
jgi:hypothetical protein